MKCPTEIAISGWQEANLACSGLMPLAHQLRTDTAVFFGADSLHKPAGYYNYESNRSVRMAARMSHVFTASRFAHYVKCIAHDRIGSFRGRGRFAARPARLDIELFG